MRSAGRLLLLLLCLTLLLGACAAPQSRDARPQIVVTVFPAYDWIVQLLGEHAEQFALRLLLDGGVDLHSYQPTTGDIAAISACDLFVYVGGSSDEWVTPLLEQAVNPAQESVCLLTLLGEGAVYEETVEGMQAEEEAEPEYDEHVWLSLRNAALLCTELCGQLCRLDPANAADYQRNLQSYLAQLDALDRAYLARLSDCPFDTLLFADRFPFRYLVEDYGLRYYAAFSGCATESDAGFSTILFLAQRLQEDGYPALLILENGDPALADTVRRTAGSDAAILRLDSMQAVTTAQAADGVSYLSLMQENLQILAQALGRTRN